VLVVLGHLAGGKGPNPPRDFDWYMTLFLPLYRFHMPFFMFLSGFISFYTYKPIRRCGDYGRYVVRSPCVSGQHICCLAA